MRWPRCMSRAFHPQGQGRDGRTVRAHVLGEHRSRINKSLDGLLRRFAQRRLDEAYPSLILDIRLDGVIQGGPSRSGSPRGPAPNPELSNRESRSSWTTFVTSLQTRGLHGVEFVVSATMPDSSGRCGSSSRGRVAAVSCTSSAMPSTICPARPPTIVVRSCAGSTRRAGSEGVAHALGDALSQAEAHIGETLNFYSRPRQHHTHLKSTNMLERLNEEIKPHAGGQDLSQRGELPTFGPSPLCRNPRGLARGSSPWEFLKARRKNWAAA